MNDTIYETIENEYSAHIIIPVTLAEVEQYPVTLNSLFGINEAEHQELLHDPNILRLLAGVQVTGDELSPDGGNIYRWIRLEAYSGSILCGGPRWDDCLSVRHHATGHKIVMVSDLRTQQYYLWQLAKAKCPDLGNRLDALAESYEDMVQTYIRDHPDDFLDDEVEFDG